MDTETQLYTFDAFTPEALHDSDRWATTNRGWLYIDGECRGFYLDYRPFQHIGYVLACSYDRNTDPVTGYDRGTVNNRSQHCATVLEAQAWLVETTIGQLALL